MRLEELTPGMRAEMTRTVTERDVQAYAEIIGDFNPVHLDEGYAARTRFGGRIAHGMLTAGFLSAVMATKLPGPGTIYLTQTLRFTKPVRIGATVTARAEVLEVLAAKRRVRLTTSCVDDAGDTVLDGEALVLLPEESA